MRIEVTGDATTGGGPTLDFKYTDQTLTSQALGRIGFVIGATTDDGVFRLDNFEGGSEVRRLDIGNVFADFSGIDLQIDATKKFSFDAGGDTFIFESSANNLRFTSGNASHLDLNATGIGFFGTTPAAQQTGVAVTAAGIHAALVTLRLITA